MSTLKRILGFVLLATAVVVGINWVITPIHHDGSPQYPVWKVVNWFMAFSVVVALIANIARKRAVGSEGADSPITREYLEANVAFYASLLLAPWFLTNFLTYDFFIDNIPAAGIEAKDVWWEFIDGLFVLVAGSTGCHLWRSAPDSQG